MVTIIAKDFMNISLKLEFWFFPILSAIKEDILIKKLKNL